MNAKNAQYDTSYHRIGEANTMISGDEMDLLDYIDELDGFRNFAFTVRDQLAYDAAMRVRVMFEVYSEQAEEDALEWFDTELAEFDDLIGDRIRAVIEVANDGDRP